MVGTATLTGRFSVAVVTASPESKVNICEVFIVLYSATDVVSAPAVIFDNELPLITAGQRKFPKTPVIRRIASPCAEPAARFPPVQARKRAGRGKNPFLFAMLFEKNIEIFSDPNPSVLCVFSICPPPFRAWTGRSREAGSWATDQMRAITGVGAEGLTDAAAHITGAFFSSYAVKVGGFVGATETSAVYACANAFDSSRVVPTGPVTVPPHVWQPIILYLGLPA